MPLPFRNLLAGETSPYLRQHADNPVHWRPWSTEALAEAAELRRPILVSIGYAACHWCHVMAHESFENDEVAAVMNRLFVNIKVDREERPDIDQIYMAALSAMGEQGGWPLTMFLTPEGKPFWGGTYFPPEPRYGRPGFVQVIEAVHRSWRDKRESLEQSADGLTAHVATKLASSHAGATLDLSRLRRLADSVHGMMDMERGGLRGAPKFPNAPFLETLWLSWLVDGNEAHRDAVVFSLEAMLCGGIYDHLGGGLARYSTDAVWLVPHFEKMLYDNAQLIRQCNWAYAETGNELFRVRIEETAEWLLREMRVDGGFASSLDADSDGEEGLFYTWNEDELEAVLGKDLPLFEKHFSLSTTNAWEGNPIVHQTAKQARYSLAAAAEASSLRRRLYDARQSRARPGRDDKVLTDWNGLAIAALAEAARSFGQQGWLAAARAVFDSIADSARAGRLPHSRLGKTGLYPALSSDYAAMANAAVSLFEATEDWRYIEQGLCFLKQLDLWHGDTDRTGHYLSASDSADVPIRIRGDVDEAIPSATSQIIEAFARLSAVSGDTGLQQRAWTLAEQACGRADHQAYGQAGIVNAAAIALDNRKLVIVDTKENPVLVPVANRSPDPRRVDLFLPLGSQAKTGWLPGIALPDTGRSGAYLCKGQVCLPPIADPLELKSKLRPPKADAV